MSILLLFLHSILFEIFHKIVNLGQVRTLVRNVNKDIGIGNTLILCSVISKSDTSVVEISLRNSWIGVSSPSGNCFHFQYRVE